MIKKYAIAVGIMAIAGTAFAAQTPSNTDSTTNAADVPSFDSLDLNNDGKISLEEARKAGIPIMVFATADKNTDAAVDKSEYDIARTAMASIAEKEQVSEITASFDKLDLNNDGKISLAEAQKGDLPIAAFAAADKNLDQSLNKYEYQAARRLMDIASSEEQTGYVRDNAIAVNFDRLDKNGDGKISLQEAREAGIPIGAFASADKNLDEALSRSEYRAAAKKDK